MQEFMYRGLKAVLITSEDLLRISSERKGLRESEYWKNKALEFKQKGIVFIFVCTSLDYIGVPKALRDIAEECAHKYCHLIITNRETKQKAT